jgi:hypothetical protein
VLRRLLAVGFGLAMLAACGGDGPSSGATVRSPPPVKRTITQTEAVAAFETLGVLKDAWKRRDCRKIAELTAGTMRALADRTCAAAQKGYEPPELISYGDAEFLLSGDMEDGAWFAALARSPKPAFFVFVESEGCWCLAAGPIPVAGRVPEITGDEAASRDPDMDLTARLVPTRHLAYLTDPAGVGGVRFPSGDPMRTLLDELLERPVKVRPDRLTADVRLTGTTRLAMLPSGGGVLVFHELNIVYTQEPGSGRSSLAHSVYGRSDVRAFTGQGRPDGVTGTELLFIATEVTSGAKMTTVGLQRVLADITPA